MLEIVSFTLGPAQTNAYLVADSETKDAAVIDPAWDGQIILEAAENTRLADRSSLVYPCPLRSHRRRRRHRGCAQSIALVALHPNDHVLWRAGGGGAFFGFDIDPGPEPTIDFYQGQILRLGSVRI